MKKFYSMFAIAAIAAFGLTSCDDDDDAPELVPVETSEGVFVMNSGNKGASIDGSVTYYDYSTNTASQNVYQAANGESLGGTVNDAIVYGSKLYIMGSDEKTVFVADKNTLKKVARIAVTVNGEAATPRHAAAAYGKVFVTTFNNAVVAIDTLSNAIADTYKCGSYSEGIAVSGGKLFVADSDYGKGNASVSMIDLKTKQTTTFKHESLNNCVGIAVANGKIYVQDSGTYDENWNQSGQGVYEISNGNVKKLGEATEMAYANGKIYTINAPYTYPATPVSYGVIDISTGTAKEFCKGTEIAYPGKISVDAVNKENVVFITSYNMNGDYADYKGKCYCTVYNADGEFVKKFDCGVGAGAVIPNTGIEYVQK